MTTRDPQRLLEDAIRHGDQARRFAAGRTLADYQADDMLRSAVERALMIVGEALSQLRQVDPALAGRISVLRDVIAFRNILVHGYGIIEDERV